MKLFISHSSKDLKITKSLVELLVNIGMTKENMFCSSVPELGIPIMEKIYDYLRNLLDDEKLFVLFLLSGNYYQSAACLNEMGAVWVKRSDYLTFLLPGYDYTDIKGAIDPSKISIKLDGDGETLRELLNQFKTHLTEHFSLEISVSEWEEAREKFISSIQPDGNISLSNCEGYCIGELTHEGCIVDEDSRCETQVTAIVDFSQTETTLCSLVISPMESNWCKWIADDRHLFFEIEIKGQCNMAFIELQVASANKNFKRKILLNQINKISLSEICPEPSKWSNVREVNFLFERKNILSRCEITIKNLHIE